ncbi:MAG: hypothetical protein TREMPRED_001462 [Tremellales sp. Tagirdzhanova-0007]|nr:MAG: hypothetical protein TREMPRED_001462 [Tremellales sp. Tagirdzhanova-0007]
MLFTGKFALTTVLIATANALMISSPVNIIHASLITCQPAALTWTGGSGGPYYIAILPGGEASAAALENLPAADASPATWNVDVAAGTNITLRVTDSSGAIAYSSSVVTQAGSSTSCLAAANASSTASSSSASASALASTSASGSSSASGSAKPTGTSSASSSSATSTSKSAGFSTRNLSGAVIVIACLAVAAFGVVV